MGNNTEAVVHEKKSPIEPYCVVNFILHNFWLVLSTALTFYMAAHLIMAVFIAPSYTSTASIAVTSRSISSTNTVLTYATESSSEQFSELLSSPSLLSNAAAEMGYQSFPGKVYSSLVKDSNIITLSVTATSPKLSYLGILAILNNYDRYTQYIFDSVVLEVASAPTIPAREHSASMRKMTPLIVGLAGGIGIIALLYFFCLISGTIQNPAGVHEKVDAELLATIPHERKRQSLKALLSKQKKSLLISNAATSFFYAESIHQIRAQIEHRKHRRGNKTFLVSSVGENEGKSTIAANIALSIAMKHNKVLLVDADLRKPAQHLVFEQEVSAEKNFGTLLQQDALTPEAVIDTLIYRKANNLFCLFTGVPRSHSTALIASERMKQLLDILRKHFDYVIIDSPPLGYFSDSELLADLCDATMLVVRQDGVTDIMVNDAIDSLELTSCSLMGVILNEIGRAHV